MTTTALEAISSHGGQVRQIAERFGISTEGLIDFSANINPNGPPRSVLPAIQHALSKPETLIQYPDLEHTKLKKIIAAYVGAHPENIAIANGFVPLLDACLRSLRTKRCLLPVPAFSEYRRSLEIADIAVIPYHLSPQSVFQYEPDSITKALLDNECDAILLANPQNPSGVLCEAEQMLRLLEKTARHNITMLLDEAFIDYGPAQSLVQQSVGYPNVVVFRSVTKFFAIPGMRLAYAVCNPSTAQALHRTIAPWPVASLASHSVCAALQEEGYAQESRQSNQQRRTWLEQKLTQVGIETYPSQTNFLLLRFPEHVNVNELWERLITEQRIILRSCSNFEGLPSRHLRTAIRAQQDNEALIHSLAVTLKHY